MKMIYVAGPYRGKTNEAVDLNIAVARKVGILCAQKGWTPVIPHSMTAGFEQACDLPDEFWLEATADMLRKCDAMILCPGWQYSSGTQGEITIASREGIDIFYSEVDLPYLGELA